MASGAKPELSDIPEFKIQSLISRFCPTPRKWLTRDSVRLLYSKKKHKLKVFFFRVLTTAVYLSSDFFKEVKFNKNFKKII